MSKGDAEALNASVADRSFGWRDADALESHGYVLPRVLAELELITEGKPVRLLDLGCGNGYVSNTLAGRGHQVIGVDQARDGILIARRAFPRVRFELLSLDDVRLGDVVGAPVDCVVALEVIEHLFEPQRLFEQSAKLIRRGGCLILSTPYHGYLKNLAISLVGGWDTHFTVDHVGGHIKFFSAHSLTRMAEGFGFRLVRWSGTGRLPLLWKSMVATFQRI